MSLIFVVFFFILLAFGVPVVFALLLAPGFGMVVDGQTAYFKLLQSTLYNGMDSFPLMAVPFFMLAGEIMNRGGIALRLVEFSKSLIGHIRGGLAHVNILCSILFAGLSGSAVADTSALGSMLIPAMEKNGYSRKFAAAVTAASSVIGPIIPPSGIMIIYAFIMDVSVAALFAAGFIPGLLVGLALMVISHIIARRRNYPAANERMSWRGRAGALRGAFLPLLTPVILLGGILGGIFTPTEASAVAAVYALFVSLFVLRTLSWSDLPAVIFRATLTSGGVLLLVGASVAFARMLTLSGAAAGVEEAVLSVSQNPLVLLFFFNVVMLLVGMVLDAGPALLIFGPIFAPIFVDLGVDPVHFAAVMCVNATIGLATPPVGLVLFVAAGISRESVGAIVREILPFLAAQIFVLLLMTYIPALSLALPRALGFL